MYTNVDCTLYLHDEGGRYNRITVERVFWDPKPGENGMATIFIPLDLAELPTIKPEERHYIVEGHVESEVYDTRTLHDFLQRYRPYTIKHIVKRGYGSKRMQHWEIQAV